MPPVKVRHQKLQAKWLTWIVAKDNTHAVYYALQRARSRCQTKSCFFALVDERRCPNSLLRRWITLSRPAVGTFFQPRHHAAVQRLTSGMIAEWMEEALQEWMDRPSWICFPGRDALESKPFRKVFFQLHRKQQRSILFWVMGLAVGWFRLYSAPSCAGAEATKAHLETVHLNVRVGPGSWSISLRDIWLRCCCWLNWASH